MGLVSAIQNLFKKKKTSNNSNRNSSSNRGTRNTSSASFSSSSPRKVTNSSTHTYQDLGRQVNNSLNRQTSNRTSTSKQKSTTRTTSANRNTKKATKVNSDNVLKNFTSSISKNKKSTQTAKTQSSSPMNIGVTTKNRGLTRNQAENRVKDWNQFGSLVSKNIQNQNHKVQEYKNQGMTDRQALHKVRAENDYVKTGNEVYDKLHNIYHAMDEIGNKAGQGVVNSAQSLINSVPQAAQMLKNNVNSNVDQNTLIRNYVNKGYTLTEARNLASQATPTHMNDTDIIDSKTVKNINKPFNAENKRLEELSNDYQNTKNLSKTQKEVVGHVANVAENATNNITNMVAGAALSAATGGVINPATGGLVTMGMNSYGNTFANDVQEQRQQAAQEAYDYIIAHGGTPDMAAKWYNYMLENANVDLEHANMKAILDAANEEVQEQISPFGSNITRITPTLSDLAMEGVQEGVGTLLDKYNDIITENVHNPSNIPGQALNQLKTDVGLNGNSKATADRWKDVGKSALGGVESAAVLGLLTNPRQTVNSLKSDAKNVSTRLTGRNDYTRDTVTAELNKDIKVAESAVAMGNTSEGSRAALNNLYEQKMDADRAYVTPENLNSEDYATRSAAQSAARDLLTTSAKRYGVKNTSLLNDISAISNKVGLVVQFEDNVGNNIDGVYKDGVILLNPNAMSTATVFAHELTHAIENSSAYSRYSNQVMKLAKEGVLKTDVSQIQSDIKKAYGEISDEELNKETTARLTEELFNSQEAIDQLVSCRRNVATRIKSWIDDTIKSLGDKNARELIKAQRMFDKALKNPNLQAGGSAEYKKNKWKDPVIEFDRGGTIDITERDDVYRGAVTMEIQKGWDVDLIDGILSSDEFENFEQKLTTKYSQMKNSAKKAEIIRKAEVEYIKNKLESIEKNRQYLADNPRAIEFRRPSREENIYASRNDDAYEALNDELTDTFSDMAPDGFTDSEEAYGSAVDEISVFAKKHLYANRNANKAKKAEIRAAYPEMVNVFAHDLSETTNIPEENIKQIVGELWMTEEQRKAIGEETEDLASNLLDKNDDMDFDPTYEQQMEVKYAARDIAEQRNTGLDRERLIEDVQKIMKAYKLDAKQVFDVLEDAGYKAKRPWRAKIGDSTIVDAETENHVDSKQIEAPQETSEEKKDNKEPLPDILMSAKQYFKIDADTYQKGLNSISKQSEENANTEEQTKAEETTEEAKPEEAPKVEQMSLDLGEEAEAPAETEWEEETEEAEPVKKPKAKRVIPKKELDQEAYNSVMSTDLKLMRKLETAGVSRETATEIAQAFRAQKEAGQKTTFAGTGLFNKATREIMESQDVSYSTASQTLRNLHRDMNKLEKTWKRQEAKAQQVAEEAKSEMPTEGAQEYTTASETVNPKDVSDALEEVPLKKVIKDTSKDFSKEQKKRQRKAKTTKEKNKVTEEATEAVAEDLNEKYENLCGKKATEEQKEANHAAAEEFANQNANNADYEEKVDAVNNENDDTMKATGDVDVSKSYISLADSSRTPKKIRDTLRKIINNVDSYDRNRIVHEVQHDEDLINTAEQNWEALGVKGLKKLAEQKNKGRNNEKVSASMSLEEQVTIEVGLLHMNDQFNSMQREFKESKDSMTDDQIKEYKSILDDYQASYDTIFDSLSTHLTKSGQAMQAAKILYQNPFGRWAKYQKSMLEIAKERNKGDVSEILRKQKEKYDDCTTDKQRDAVLRETDEILAQKLAILPDKFGQWRYTSMLCNPKTFVRNDVSNGMTYSMFRAGDWNSYLAERMIKSVAGQEVTKSHVLKVKKEYLDFAKQYAAEQNIGDEVGNKYHEGQLHSDRMFNDNYKAGRILNDISEKTSAKLNKSDMDFINKRFSIFLAEQMQASDYTLKDGALYETKNGVETKLAEGKQADVLNKMGDRAYSSALEATYHDASAFADWVNKGRKANIGLRMTLDAVLPFTKTPANIARRSIEFSPVGFFKTLTYDYYQVKKGKMDANTYIDHLGRGMTGMELLALGGYLASQGILHGGSDDDKDKDETYYRSDIYGDQNYALYIGDKRISLDWAMPSVSAVCMGAQIFNYWNKAKNGEGDVSDFLLAVAKGASTALDPIMSMTMLGSINDALQTYSNAGDKVGLLSAFFMSAGGNLISQMVPTVFGALNRSFMSRKRYAYNTDLGKNYLNNIMMRIPGAAQLLPVTIDDNGNEVLNTGTIYGVGADKAFDSAENAGKYAVDTASRLLYNTLIPATITTSKAYNTSDELLRLKAQGQDVLPGNIYSLYGPLDEDGNYTGKVDITGKDLMDAKSIYAKEFRSYVDEFMKSDLYTMNDDGTKSNDEYKGKVIKALYNYAIDKARVAYFGEANLDYTKVLRGTDKALYELEKKGVSPVTILAIRNSGLTGTEKAFAARAALEQADALDTVRELAEDGTIKLTDVGLTTKVANMTAEEFDYEQDNAEATIQREQAMYSSEDLIEKERIEKTMKGAGVSIQKLYAARYADSTKDSYGNNITYSQDINARKALGEDNITKIKEAVDAGEMTMDEAAIYTTISKKILSMDTEHFKDFADNNQSNFEHAVDVAKQIGVNADNLFTARECTTDYDETGASIKYSKGINARKALGEDNLQKFKDAVNDGLITIDDAVKITGISKKIFKMSTEDFNAEYGDYVFSPLGSVSTAEAAAKSYKSGGSSEGSEESTGTSSGKKKSSKKRRRKRKRTSSSSTSSDTDETGAEDNEEMSAEEKKHQKELQKRQLQIASAFAKAMAKASSKNATASEKALKSSLSDLSKLSQQQIYNKVMSSKSLQNKLGLTGIKIESSK